MCRQIIDHKQLENCLNWRDTCQVNLGFFTHAHTHTNIDVPADESAMPPTFLFCWRSQTPTPVFQCYCVLLIPATFVCLSILLSFIFFLQLLCLKNFCVGRKRSAAQPSLAWSMFKVNIHILHNAGHDGNHRPTTCNLSIIVFSFF